MSRSEQQRGKKGSPEAEQRHSSGTLCGVQQMKLGSGDVVLGSSDKGTDIFRSVCIVRTFSHNQLPFLRRGQP